MFRAAPRDGSARWSACVSRVVQEAPMQAGQATALHRVCKTRREELQKSLLVSYAASPSI